MSDFILALLIFTGFFIQTITGFGSSLIILTFGILCFDLYELLPMVLQFNIVMSFYFLIRFYQYLDLKFLFKFVLVYMGLGFIIGLGFSSYLKHSSLPMTKIFSTLVFTLSLIEIFLLLVKKNIQIYHPFYGKIWIFFAGIIHAIFATGGPFLVYGLSHIKIEPFIFRISLLFVWLIFDSLLLFHIPYNREHLIKFIFLAWILPLSIYLGQRVYEKISLIKFNFLIRLLLMLISIITLINGKSLN